MAAQIRQEINLMDRSFLAVADSTLTEIVQLDTSQYNGTVTYYFEVICSKSAGADGTISLRRSGTTTDDATIANVSIGTSVALVRSAAFTPPAGATEYRVFVDITSGTVTVKAARIIIIQNATTLTNTETQIEIGNYNLARTAETATILVNPKYWKYDASKWDGTKTFYAEAVYDSGDMDTISVYIYESAAIDAPSWSSVATIVSAATTTTSTRTRVSFTPTDGRYYTIFSLNGSMDNHDIYRAGVVVDSFEGAYTPALPTGGTAGVQGGTGGAGEDNQAQAQAFTLSTGTGAITGVYLGLSKSGTPADNLVVDLVSTLGGSVLATASVSGASLSTTQTRTLVTFGTPYTPSVATTYYIQLTRSGARDATNYYVVSHTGSGLGTYTNGNEWKRANTSWAEQSGNDFYFELTGITGLTKLEPQYLLANTLLAAGTALQTFLTEWDSTEWDDGSGSITYYFQGEAANGSTSDMTLQEADGGGAVTNSTLTNIDNAQISAAMTMPADQNLDVIANANAGDVAAARILVTYIFSAALSGSVKTVNGLAIASVKTVNGLAIASVKTIKGLSTT